MSVIAIYHQLTRTRSLRVAEQVGEYRRRATPVVSRTMQRVGETLPGPWREEKLASTPKGYLMFEGKLYRRVDDLEPSVRELLHGTAEAAWK